jgi:hypothetical protein
VASGRKPADGLVSLMRNWNILQIIYSYIDETLTHWCYCQRSPSGHCWVLDRVRFDSRSPTWLWESWNWQQNSSSHRSCRSVHNNNNYECDQCGQIMKSIKSLHYHINLQHSIELNRRLFDCDKSFNRSSSFKIHIISFHSSDASIVDNITNWYWWNSEVNDYRSIIRHFRLNHIIISFPHITINTVHENCCCLYSHILNYDLFKLLFGLVMHHVIQIWIK